MYILAYLIPILSGIVVYVLYADKNNGLKFHAIQSILYGIAILVAYYILNFIFAFSFIFISILPLLALLYFLAWLYGLYIGYQAYNGTSMQIPVVGEIASKQ